MKLHNRLKEVRVERGLTQEVLAKEAGVTRQTIIAIEKEKFVPSVKLALELVATLRISLDSIFWLNNQ